MHDHGEPASQRNAGLPHGGPLGDRERPVLQLERRLVTGQHHIGGLIEQRSQSLVTALADPADIVDFA